MGGPANLVRATLSPADPKVGDRMSIAAHGLVASQVATLRVHTPEDDLSVTAHADDSGAIAYANWHVYRAPGSYALGVEVNGKVVATTTVEVA